jgi:uncharacterized protein YuzE
MPPPYRIEFNVAWDDAVDVAYLTPLSKESIRDVGKTVPIIDRAQQLYGTIDLSSDGALLGIEILGARRMLPELSGMGQEGGDPEGGDPDK